MRTKKIHRTKTTRIKTEMVETTTVRPDTGKMIHLCAKCSPPSDHIRLDEAVDLFRIATVEILRGIQDRAIHWTQSERGHLLVCRQSLTKTVERNQRFHSTEQEILP